MSIKNIIPAEIDNDEMANEITKLIKLLKPKTMLEIGSSSGEGSTQAFLRGIEKVGGNLYCIEASDSRYARLVENVSAYNTVYPYWTTSVADSEAMSDNEVHRFFGLLTGLIDLPVFDIGEDRVLKWKGAELHDVDSMKTPRDGIRRIKAENNIDKFDMVLIDGSPFTAIAELSLVHGAKIIAMDDTMAMKCFEINERMKRDKAYRLYKENKTLRNGYSIWLLK